MKKIVIISNTLSSLFIFRSELINKLSELNYKIYLLSNKDEFDDELNEKILKKNNINYADYGCTFSKEWHQIFFQDPEGNVVEIHQEISK